MKSSTATQPRASSLQDPVTLPNEIFLNLFNFLSSKLILDSSTVSREWRTIILSSPSAFAHLDLSEDHDNDTWKSKTDEEQGAMASRLINKIRGFSNLSNNRLKSAALSLLPAFQQDITALWGDCSDSTTLTFEILSHSSSTLKILTLDIDPPPQEDLYLYLLYLINVIKKFKLLKSLKEVTIFTDFSFKLESGSADSKVVSIHNGFQMMEPLSEDEVDKRTGESIFARLFQEITNFTGKGLLSIEFFSGLILSLEGLKKLEHSKGTLEKLSLLLGGSPNLAKHTLRFSIGCPNLVDLELFGSDFMEDGTFQMEFPKTNAVSNLKKLMVTEGKATPLALNRDFFRWAGGKGILESLDLDGYDVAFESADLESFVTFLLTCSSSLRSLRLYGFSLSLGTISQQVILPNLTTLRLKGPSSLINFFTDISFASLKEVDFDVQGQSERLQLNHSGIVQLLKSCQASLEMFQVSSDLKPDYSNKKIVLFKTERGTSFSLPKLWALDLHLDDEIISEFYLPIGYPKLKRIEIPSSSRLS